MKYEQKSFTVPQQTSKICGCEKCIYGSGEHTCQQLFTWGQIRDLEDDLIPGEWGRMRLRDNATKLGILHVCKPADVVRKQVWQPYYEWLLDLKALVVELAEIPQKDGE